MNNWHTVCGKNELVAGAGITALVEGEAVAIFYLPEHPSPLYAIGNYDPIGGANVLSRGIVGDIGGELVVASPLYKHHFSLASGECLEDSDFAVPLWEARIDGEEVRLRRAHRVARMHQTGT